MKAKDLPISTKGVDLECGFYYVSCINNNGKIGLVLGPFDYHQKALNRVNECRKFVSDRDPWSDFWGWGTLRLKDGIVKGKLNEYLLGKESAD